MLTHEMYNGWHSLRKIFKKHLLVFFHLRVPEPSNGALIFGPSFPSWRGSPIVLNSTGKEVLFFNSHSTMSAIVCTWSIWSGKIEEIEVLGGRNAWKVSLFITFVKTWEFPRFHGRRPCKSVSRNANVQQLVESALCLF